MSTQTQTAAPVATTAPAKAKTGDVILDTVTHIEQLTKTKALNLAEKLVEEQGSNDFQLGGVFLRIQEQGWFDGYESFDAFVSQKFGIQSRKAYYLIDIYKNLTTKNIPWEKVSALGWTKLRDLAPVLTAENTDEWVAKAKELTVVQLQAVIKSGTPSEEGAQNVTGSSDSVTFKIKLQKDQLDTVSNAIAKAKADIGSTFDAVGLETICAGYMGGTVSAGAVAKPLADVIKEAGWDKVLEVFGQVFPGVDLTITNVAEDPTKPAPAAAPAAPAADAPAATA